MKRPWRDQAVVAILLFGGLGLPPAIVQAHGRHSQGTYVTTAQVDVKAGPHEGYETVRTFRKGITFEIAGKEGVWLRIHLAEHVDRFGYVDQRFAVVKDRDARMNPRPAIPGTYLASKPIEVRLGPGEEYTIASIIPKGTRIIIVGMEGEWLRIAARRGDSPAYVKRRSAFLEPAD